MKKKSSLDLIIKNYGFYILPLFVVFLGIYLFLKVDKPKIEEAQNIREQLKGIQERLSNLTTKSKLLSSLDEIKLKQDIERTSLILPDAKDAPSIIRNLEYVASESGAFIDDFALVPGKIATASVTTEQSNAISIGIGISGKTLDLMGFVNKIAGIGRAMGFNTLDLGYTDGTVSARVSLSVAAYFLMPPAVLGKVDEPVPAWGAREKEVLDKVYERVIPSPITETMGVGKTNPFK